jgi:hypothetical protein
VHLSTFHFTGAGQYDVDSRGSTTGPEVAYGDLATTYEAAWNPPADQFNASGFMITSVTRTSSSGGIITGSVNAIMGDTSKPDHDPPPPTATVSGSFEIPYTIEP